MRSVAAARRYARALFSLARETNALADIRREIDDLAELFETEKVLREALMTPLHPASQRKAVISAIVERAGISGSMRHFLLFLVDQRRLVAFDAIRDEFERLTNEASGLVTAEVVAASPLDERRQDRLRRALSDRTGQEVRLDIRVDPSLIGGAIATVGDTVFDGSLRTQLEKLRANLTKGS
jgi:F-type H+-transporting ATPase subunit delta